MPFTPSHAVVALPFVRTPLVPAAIAVGAMTPDLPLFVRGIPLHYGLTHSLIWLPATIALALVLLLVWRCVLRPAARELSPRRLAERLPALWDRGAGDAARETFARRSTDAAPPRPSVAATLLLLASLVIGLLTHIVWDLFTHEGRWGTLIVPALAEPWGPFPGYRWLQHGSSAVGLAILAVWATVWLATRHPVDVPRLFPGWVRWTVWLSLPALLVGAAVWGLVAFGPFTADFTPAHLAYRMLPPACAAWGALVVVVCAVVQIVRSRGSHSGESEPHVRGAA
ncbi:hypothetical protein GCM10022200_01020 [Microbacterium awajiense]|uniref:DUF4184 family protein n=1 Tax=Microbacterium awajiense TaxID=415214 RepID=A0ABP7A0L3_9MICO